MEITVTEEQQKAADILGVDLEVKFNKVLNGMVRRAKRELILSKSINEIELLG